MRRRAFTIIELVVVIGIMLILVAIMMPAIKSMTRSNNRSQSTNMIRAYIASARASAISQHRRVGVVFFEETLANIPTANPNQTAVQTIIEVGDQSRYVLADNTQTPNIVYTYLSRDRQYLPRGMQVAVFNDDAIQTITTGGAAAGSAKARVILFNPDGQLVLNSGIATPSPMAVGSYTPTSDGYYPVAYGDWNLPAHNTTDSSSGKPSKSSLGVSSPGVVVFSMADYKQQGFTSSAASQATAAAWIKQNADILIVNPYTGNILAP